MLTFKSFAALCTLAAAGVIGTGKPSVDAAQTGLAYPAFAAVPTPTRAIESNGTEPAISVLQTMAEGSLLDKLKADLGSNSLTAQLAPANWTRTAYGAMEGRGTALLVLAPGTAPVPLKVTVAYDLPSGQLDSLDYQLVAKTSLAGRDWATRQAFGSLVARALNAQLAKDFAQQASRFTLITLQRAGSGGGRVIVIGEGRTNFTGEGSARTRFIAALDAQQHRLTGLRYELLEQVEEPSDALASN